VIGQFFNKHTILLKVVGDPGIEPGVRLREGVTVPCHTLRPVAQPVGGFIVTRPGRQHQNTDFLT